MTKHFLFYNFKNGAIVVNTVNALLQYNFLYLNIFSLI